MAPGGRREVRTSGRTARGTGPRQKPTGQSQTGEHGSRSGNITQRFIPIKNTLIH